MTNPYSTVSLLEDRIYAASPAGLTLILMEQAGVAIRAALASVAEKDPRRRAREVTRLLEILTELAMSLQGDEPEVRKRKTIYASLQSILVEAHAEVSVEKLEVVERTFANLLAQWKEVCVLLDGGPSGDTSVQDEEAPASFAVPAGYGADREPAGSGSSRGWTF